MSIIKELLLKRKARFVLYIIACFMPVLSQFMVNYIIALFIGSVEIGSIDYFTKVLLLALGASIISSMLYILSRFLRISYMRDTLLDVRIKAFDKILKLSYKDFNMKSRESYISNLVNDINIFENNFFLKLINLIFNGGVYVISLFILIIIDFKFATVIFMVSIVLFLLNKSFEKKTVELQEEVSEYNEKFSIDASNTFNGLEILKLNNIEDKFLNKFLKSIDKVERKKFGYTVFADVQFRLANFLGLLIIISTMVYLLTLTNKGISFTTITFMLQLSNSSVWSMTKIPPLANELKSSVNIYEKITKVIDEDEDKEVKKREFSFKDKIEVKKLSFSYGDKEILKDASFNIKKGKKYLLKGPSGVGKSTLIKLLSMVYENYEGEILLDGADYREISEKSLSDNISYIYQDVFLFEDSILNNVTLYKYYDKEKLENAVYMAGLKEFLDKRESGIDEEIIENGKNLSGGERQRISIARAIIKDASILFIDEATSALDKKLGAQIEDTILNLESTVLAISHRYYPEITEKYDYVLELSNGRINEYSSEEYFKEVAIL